MKKSSRFLRMLRKNFKRKRPKTHSSPDVFPVKGCVLKCNLGVVLEHTGLYIGDGKIVSLNRHSQIRIESERSFFPPGTNPESNRIYTACYGKTDEVLSSSAIALRARKKVNQQTPYNVLFNNCHRFTTGCITGDFENDVVSFSQLEEVILAHQEKLHKTPWWLRLKNFILRTPAPEPANTFNWRPVKFKKKKD
ncbi:MAG: lecithin retinol acyltransferase family protein [Alphaproteobacteria bacterium]|nr:lecithin retinol acyltransferase family protein [Alphaproteobacteria bacterium]